MFILDRDPMPPGSPLLMELHLGRERLECSGVVCRTVPGLGMGVQFKGLSREAQSHLEKQLAALAKAAPTPQPPSPAESPVAEPPGRPVIQNPSSRLESLTAEFEELRHALKVNKVDPAVLAAFRQALDLLRDTAWAVQQRSELEARDPGAPRPSLLTRERIQRAAQLGQNLGLEIASEEAPLDADALEDLYHSIENLHQRLSLYFKPEG